MEEELGVRNTFSSETDLSDDDWVLILPSSDWHGMIILSSLELLLQVSGLLPCQISISCHALGFTHSCSLTLSILKKKNTSSGLGVQWTSRDPLSSFPCQILLSGLLCASYPLAIWRLWYVFCTVGNVHHSYFHAQLCET